MDQILKSFPIEYQFAQVLLFHVIVYGIVFYIYHRSFKKNWSKLHALAKGTGIVVMLGLPIYGFSLFDGIQFMLRSKDLGGERYHVVGERPEGVLLVDGGCGTLCQEMLLEAQVRYVESPRVARADKQGLQPAMRYEKRTGVDACPAQADAVPPAALEPGATGRVPLLPAYRAAEATDACVAYVVIEDVAAPVAIRTWPPVWRHAPTFFNASSIIHHEIYRRSAAGAVEQVLAESEAGWVDVLAFPPRLRASDGPDGGLSVMTRLSYEAAPLEALINRTLAMELNGRLDLPAGEIAALVAALEDDDPVVRRAVTAAIGAMGPAADRAVPALIGRLGDADDEVADRARVALARIGAAAVKPLAAAVSDPSARVRMGAVRALGGIGPDARAAGPVLARILRRQDDPRRAVAAWALGQLRWTEGVPTLLAALESPDRELHNSAKFALARIGDAAVPGLMARLDHEDAAVRLRAADALGTIGPAAGDALSALRAGLGSGAQVNYRWAIERIEAGTSNRP